MIPCGSSGLRGFFVFLGIIIRRYDKKFLPLHRISIKRIKRDTFSCRKSILIDMMSLDTLTAISPIDGRYRGKTELLAGYFSEYALIKYRIRVEIEYFIALCRLPLPQLADFDATRFPLLRAIYEEFTEEDARRVKDIEKVTNHAVKAVEYFIK